MFVYHGCIGPLSIFKGVPSTFSQTVLIRAVSEGPTVIQGNIIILILWKLALSFIEDPRAWCVEIYLCVGGSPVFFISFISLWVASNVKAKVECGYYPTAETD